MLRQRLLPKLLRNYYNIFVYLFHHCIEQKSTTTKRYQWETYSQNTYLEPTSLSGPLIKEEKIALLQLSPTSGLTYSAPGQSSHIAPVNH